MASLQSIEVKVKADLQTGVVGAIFNFFCGRATTFAIIFTAAGLALAFEGKLTAEFVAFVGAIQALIFAHSFKEDVHEQRMARLEMQGKDTEEK